MFELKSVCRHPDLLRRADGFWRYMRPEFASHLDTYLPVFERYRTDMHSVPTEKQWQQLPDVDFATDKSWQWRRESLAVFNRLTNGKRFETTLEIGAWNGWLTKHLAEKSGAVVAADYFSAPLDGIGKIETLSPNIFAVQCELEQIGNDFLPQSFDLIVMNHNLAYTENPIEFLQRLKPLLKPGGTIITLGNTVFGNTDKKIHRNHETAIAFEKKYGIPFYISPLKGYLNRNDVTLLAREEFTVVSYPKKTMQNLYSKINPAAPKYFGLIYTKR